MLHMVVMSHTAESCPGRAGNEAVIPCLQSMDEKLREREVGVVGRWADPPAHVSYLVLEAASAHVIQEVIMESGLAAYTTTVIRPVMSMD